VRDLGDGLILRRATPEDAEALGAFNARIHSDNGPDQPDERLAAWTRDLLTRPHPTFAPGDFTLVEEAATGRIVSSLNLINQTWAYAGIPFGVGRPELVGTLPEYRNRGLVRAQFELIHGWSAKRGHKVQAITGIPFYYRQFGYEMGLALSGGRSGFAPQVPRLGTSLRVQEGEAEPYQVRAATAADVAFIAGLYDQVVVGRDLITCARTPELWRYEIEGRSPESLNAVVIRVIETSAGETVGYLAHIASLATGGAGNGLACVAYELKPGVSWLAVTPSVVRYLWAAGEAQGEREGKPNERFIFALGAEHPVYQAWQDRLPVARPPYAWYVRVADLPGFLRHIAPALEARLARSLAAGHSAELKLSFYRSGVRLVLEGGRLAAIEPWQPRPSDDGSAAFPNLTFLQLLFGYRGLDELRQAYADCWTNEDETRALLTALFPRQASNVWGVV
jgi:hypothetical protein